VEGSTLVKLESEWNETDVKLIELNCKAMSTLYCALDPIEYNRVSGCDSAKEGTNLKLLMKELIKLRNLK
jgi:hypothetical protein